MSDNIKLVIEIDKRAYEACRELRTNNDDGITGLCAVNAIANGTPLPKGHGRLIDADALDLEKEVSMADDWKTAHEIANCVKYAPTIIEADEAESEDT